MKENILKHTNLRRFIHMFSPSLVTFSAMGSQMVPKLLQSPVLATGMSLGLRLDGIIADVSLQLFQLIFVVQATAETY